MGAGCDQLFEYALTLVTRDDVALFAPDDPGHREYVREFERILERGELPERANFAVTETIGLTRWAHVGQEAEEARFRRFRVFTNAVGVGLLAKRRVDDDALPGNYLAISLIDDAAWLGDVELLRRMGLAFEALFFVLEGLDSGESVFLLLGTLLVRIRCGAGEGEVARLIESLMAAEKKYFGTASNEFLWGCTHYDQLHGQWKRFVGEWLVGSWEGLKLLREGLLGK